MRTFSLGAGADVVKFTSASSADANTIIGFSTTGTKKDKLSFDKTNVFKAAASADAFTAANGNTTTIASDEVYKGTATQIKAIKNSSSDALGTTFAIATDTGEIYAVTDKGGNSGVVDTVVIGSVDAAAAVAITSAVTFSDFILLA